MYTYESIEYEDSFSPQVLRYLKRTINDLITTWSEFDEWDYIHCEVPGCNIALTYNLYLDFTDGDLENSSAFYVMYYDPHTRDYEVDYSDFYHYEIDFDDPNWRANVEAFAKNLLLDIINDPAYQEVTL